MLIVTGIGRCGTNLMMQFLEALEWHLSSISGFYRPRQKGYELRGFLRMNERMLREVHTVGAINTRRFEKRVLNLKYDAIKDPRFSWHPLVLDAWWTIRKDIKILYMDRDEHEVAMSFRRLIKLSKTHSPRYLPDLSRDSLRAVRNAFLGMVERLKVPCAVVKFPDCVYDNTSVLQAFDMLYGSTLGASGDAWQKIADPNKVTDWREREE